MSTTVSTSAAPAATVKVSEKILTAIKAVLRKDGELQIAIDNLRSTCVTETAKHGYQKPQLTGILLDAGYDAARTSEIVGFVFPAHSEARKELDKALAHNAKQTDHKKRIAKPVILAIQRDKTGELTLDKALAEHAKKQQLKDDGAQQRVNRVPGETQKPGEAANATSGSTESTKNKPLTPQQVDEALGNLICAALAFAKANGYDEADYEAVSEQHKPTYFTPVDASDEATDDENAEEPAE